MSQGHESSVFYFRERGPVNTEKTLEIAPLHALGDVPTLFNARPVNDPNEVSELFRQVF